MFRSRLLIYKFLFTEFSTIVVVLNLGVFDIVFSPYTSQNSQQCSLPTLENNIQVVLKSRNDNDDMAIYAKVVFISPAYQSNI